MNRPDLLIPLRVPELGPSLGKLVTGTGRADARFSLEQDRCTLATRVMEMAGEARRLAAEDERADALRTLGADAWLSAWEDGIALVTQRVLGYLTAQLEAETTAVRMPARIQRRVLIDDPEQRAIAARIAACGAGLVAVLEQIDPGSEHLLRATGSQRDELERWQRNQAAAARRLEEAWLQLEAAVDRELDTWHSVAQEISRWRRPLWPVVVVGVSGAMLALWIGLMLGGISAPPAWLGSLLPFLNGQ